MGFETFIRFERNSADPRPYAPEAFLRQLDTEPSSLDCAIRPGTGAQGGPATVFEYRLRGSEGRWPAVVVSIVAEGFLVCEYDRAVGTRLLGALVKYALDHAKDERVVVESA